MSNEPLRPICVIGVGEPEPPRLPWRPLRAVIEDERTPAWHRWSMGGDIEQERLTTLPAAVFDQACELGEAVRFESPLQAGLGSHVVRVSDGEYRVVSKANVRALRSRALTSAVEHALHAHEAGETERCLDLLYRGCLAETRVPLASVTLVGLALEHEYEEWSEPALVHGLQSVEDCDLQVLASSLAWRGLPYSQLRDSLLQHTESHLRKRAVVEGEGAHEPVPTAALEDAALLLATRQLAGRNFACLRRLSHRDLTRLASGDAEIVASLLYQVGREGGVEGRAGTLALLTTVGRQAVGREQLRAKVGGFMARLRRPDWLNHSRAFATLDATMGRDERHRAWRSARGLLPRAWAKLSDQPPWKSGELAASELREELALDSRAPIPALTRMATQRFGLACFATRMSHAAYDACHVVSSLPPAAYLDVDKVVPRSAPRRFAVAKNLGFQIFARQTPGAHLSTAPIHGCPGGARTEAEQAANAFAAYFLAPKKAVREVTAESDLSSGHGYEVAVREVVSRFGVSASCSFHHVANCHHIPVRRHWERYESILSSVQSAEDGSFEETLVEVPELPPGCTVPLERADGFCSRLAEVVAAGHLEFDAAARYLGGDPQDARQLLRQRMVEIAG